MINYILYYNCSKNYCYHHRHRKILVIIVIIIVNIIIQIIIIIILINYLHSYMENMKYIVMKIDNKNND